MFVPTVNLLREADYLISYEYRFLCMNMPCVVNSPVQIPYIWDLSF